MRHELEMPSRLGVIAGATLAAALCAAQLKAQPAGSAAEVLAAEAKLEEATTKGDTAYFDSAVADDIEISVIQEQVEMGVAIRMAVLDALSRGLAAGGRNAP